MVLGNIALVLESVPWVPGSITWVLRNTVARGWSLVLERTPWSVALVAVSTREF